MLISLPQWRNERLLPPDERPDHALGKSSAFPNPCLRAIPPPSYDLKSLHQTPDCWFRALDVSVCLCIIVFADQMPGEINTLIITPNIFI